MSGQQTFFTSDTAIVREPRKTFAETLRTKEPLVAPLRDDGSAQTNAPRKTLAERLVAAWLAPWTHGFTPLW